VFSKPVTLNIYVCLISINCLVYVTDATCLLRGTNWTL